MISVNSRCLSSSISRLTRRRSAALFSVSPSPARDDGHYKLQVQKKLGAKIPQKNVTEQRLRGERVRVIWSKRGETGACMRKPSHACSYGAVHTRCKCTHGVHKASGGGACDEQTSACLLFFGRANYSSLTWLVSRNNVWATHSQAAAGRARLGATANHSSL